MQLHSLSGSSFGLSALNRASEAIDIALEQLATGTRINRASDDPSGIVALAAFNAELAGIEGSIDGLLRTDARLSAQEGALSEVSDLTIKLEGLIVSAAGGFRSPDELAAMQLEADSIINAIDQLGGSSSFNGQPLLEGYSSSDLGLRPEGGFDLINGDLEALSTVAGDARQSVATSRAQIGSEQRGIETDISRKLTQFEEVSKAASLLGDTDYAKTSSELIRAQVLQQATIQTMLIHRQSAEGTLKLLSGLTENQ